MSPRYEGKPTPRWLDGLEPRTVTAIGAAQDGGAVIDAVMVAGTLDDDVLLQTHDAVTVEHAGIRFELHGTGGSLVATEPGRGRSAARRPAPLRAR